MDPVTNNASSGISASATLAQNHLPDDVLLIFIGHSDDAKEEANAIFGLEQELQRELQKLRVYCPRLISTSVRCWEWEHDIELIVGGQEQTISPYIDRSVQSLRLRS